MHGETLPFEYLRLTIDPRTDTPFSWDGSGSQPADSPPSKSHHWCTGPSWSSKPARSQWHICRAIYRKLDVGHRKAAVQAARDLHVI